MLPKMPLSVIPLAERCLGREVRRGGELTAEVGRRRAAHGGTSPTFRGPRTRQTSRVKPQIFDNTDTSVGQELRFYVAYNPDAKKFVSFDDAEQSEELAPPRQ